MYARKKMKATLFSEARPTDQANCWYHSVAVCHGEKAKKTAASDIQHHLELRLTIPSNSNSNDTAMTSASNGQSSSQDSTSNPDVLVLGQKKFKLAPTTAATSLISAAAAAAAATAEGCFINPHGMPSGFVHPWSLAARQQRAAYEKACWKPGSSRPSMPRVTHPLVSSLVVGWPPIRKFWENLSFKSRMSHGNGANPMQANQGANVPALGNPMFVKVHMEGVTVGRKINLGLFHGYVSFFHTMKKLYLNFLTAYIEDIDDGEDVADDISNDFYVLYEDNEGDTILVGDVPWNDFVASVKRLFIVPKEGTDDSFGGAQGFGVTN